MLDTFRGATPEALAAIADEQGVRQTQELFLLFAMGSQFDHLIKQALERLGVFCLVADPASVSAADVQRLKPTGIIVSGGPASVHSEPPPFDDAIFDLGVPTLGICLGFQMWAKHVGCRVVPSPHREFGVHKAVIHGTPSKLFEGCPGEIMVLQSHGDRIEVAMETDRGMRKSAWTEHAPFTAGHCHHLYGVQFHPEVTDTLEGMRMFENFCFGICGAKDRYPAQETAARKIATLREQIGDKRVLLALSGGSDSSTVAYLLKEAVRGVPGQVRAVYIRGIDRPDDERFVHEYFGSQSWLELRIVDATERFLAALADKVSMKDKRLAMRGVYKGILEQEAADFGAAFIAQGTLYTDICESGGGHQSGARKAQIKLHHNTNLGFNLPEIAPLSDCVKDGGRNIGRSIGVPEVLLVRHPFPGPGLVVRIEGEVTAAKLAVARQIDGIYIEELRKWELYAGVWQAGAVVTQSVTTCTKGDDAASGWIVALWAVWSVNGFTAQAAELPWDFLKRVSRRMTNEVREVGAVCYRASDKPPTTIEWG
jgi:GMP synthase (glutamine-hydrolysing)